MLIRTAITLLKNKLPFLRSKQSFRVIPWFRDNGDKTHRMNYDLNEKSMVFDLGGYEGQWTSDIFAMYCCNIHVFEPYQEYFQNINNRFAKNSKITAHSFGLSDSNKNVSLSISDNSSSTFKGGDKNNTAQIKLVNAIDFINENKIDKINLMKINIEGGEYELLDHLIKHSIVSKIENLQIQFHDFVPDAEKRMKTIQNHLKETHFLTYQYEFVWENWKLK